MKYTINQIKNHILDINIDAGELVQVLELTVADILEAFPYELLANAEKFNIENPSTDEDDTYEEHEDEVEEAED